MKGKCLNPIVLAWAAGFVDGEGCIRIAKRKNPSNPVYSLEITISQNCIETLEHFKEVLGIDCGRSRIHSGTARVKSDVYYLTYRSQNALRLLRLLRPYLIRKRTEAEYGIAFARHVTLAQKKRWHTRKVPHSPAEIATRQHYYELLRSLKPRGKPAHADAGLVGAVQVVHANNNTSQVTP